MEADAFVRRRRLGTTTAEEEAPAPGSSPPPPVAGASAGAEVRWLLGGGGVGGVGRGLWGISESSRTNMSFMSPPPPPSLPPPPFRLRGEGGIGELQKVHFGCVAVPADRRLLGGDQGDPLHHHHRDCGAGGGGDEDQEPDYEGLPVGASTSTHMLAGAVAGIMEHCLMFPIDCVKTRMQSLQPDPAARYRNVMDALRRIVTTEGVLRPIRGLNATAVGAGPAHALYFACYEKLKKTLSDAIHPGANSHLANGAAGCVATLLHDAAMNPSEVVKQRMQMYNSPYRGVLECVRAVWAAEGAAAFYRSYTTQLTMNVPFQALHFMTYEYLQELFNPRRQYNPSSHVVSGALAGALAAAATTPLDVCKTLLNTQESLALRPVAPPPPGLPQGQGPGGGGGGGGGGAPPPHSNASNANRHISGLAHAFRTVYRLGGLRGFLKGVQARVIYQVPSTAISWSVYEFFKYGITKHQHEKRRAQQQQHREAEM